MEQTMALRISLCGVATLLLCAPVPRAQARLPEIHALTVSKLNMAEEVGRLAGDGYRIVLADIASDFLIVQTSDASRPVTYRFADDLATRLRANDWTGDYHLLPQTFGFDGEVLCGLFSKADTGDGPRQYMLLDAGSAGELDKKGHGEYAQELSPVAIDAGRRVAAIFERTPNAPPWKIVATSRTGSMQDELNALGAQGYQIVDGSGGRELAYIVSKTADASPVDYRVIATTKSTTLERELNRAMAEGFTFIPSSLAALSGGGSPLRLRVRTTNETVAVMAKTATRARVTYKVVGARRVATIDKELVQAAAEGFTAVAAVVGYEETVVVLEREDPVR